MQRHQVNHAVRTFVSIGIIGAFVGVWLWKIIHDEQINAILFAVVVLLAIASAYSVFGKWPVDSAVDTYENLRGDSDDSGED